MANGNGVNKSKGVSDTIKSTIKKLWPTSGQEYTDVLKGKLTRTTDQIRSIEREGRGPVKPRRKY